MKKFFTMPKNPLLEKKYKTQGLKRPKNFSKKIKSQIENILQNFFFIENFSKKFLFSFTPQYLFFVGKISVLFQPFLSNSTNPMG